MILDNTLHRGTTLRRKPVIQDLSRSLVKQIVEAVIAENGWQAEVTLVEALPQYHFYHKGVCLQINASKEYAFVFYRTVAWNLMVIKGGHFFGRKNWATFGNTEQLKILLGIILEKMRRTEQKTSEWTARQTGINSSGALDTIN